MRPPNLLLALTDAPRALLDAGVLSLTRPLLRHSPRAASRQSVMVLPGFFGDDRGNRPLLKFLRNLGYNAVGWGQGQNLGPTSFDAEALRERIETLLSQGDGKLSLIGHSLGGLYAREIAKAEPHVVRQVITLGSPFGRGHEQGSHASRIYQRLNPQTEPAEADNQLETPPPVHTTAIYTRADGIVNWRTSVQEGGHPQVHNVEVLGSHIGLNLNVTVWYWIARKLAEHADRQH